MSTKRQFNTWRFEQHNWTHGHAFTASSVISSLKACGCVFISSLIPCSSKAYSRRISAGCSMELFYFFLRESIKMFGVRPFVAFFALIHFFDTYRMMTNWKRTFIAELNNNNNINIVWPQGPYSNLLRFKKIVSLPLDHSLRFAIQLVVEQN